MTLSRYLTREICKPFGFILGVLTALFASYCLASILANAVDALLPIGAIGEIVLLKVLISLEVLIPISLFAGVVLGLGRLYADSEMTAMAAAAISPLTLLGTVLTVSGYMALGVAGLSLLGRPFAYRQLAALSQVSGAILNVDAMSAGTFYSGQNGGRVIYLTRRDGPDAPAEAVFVWLRYQDHTEIIHARQAQTAAELNAGAKVDLSDAHIYDIGYAQAASDHVVDAQSLLVLPENDPGAPPRYSTAAMSNARLAAAHTPASAAELQWRLSTPASTLLLGLCGLPLSRTQPRQTPYARFGAVIVIYSLYYLVCMSARSLVQQGIVPGFPGLWWAPALLGAVLAAAALWPAPWRRSARR